MLLFTGLMTENKKNDITLNFNSEIAIAAVAEYFKTKLTDVL